MSWPICGLATDGFIYDASFGAGRKTQQISKETCQPVLNSACNPGDQRSKAFDESFKYVAGDKSPGLITKKDTPAGGPGRRRRLFPIDSVESPVGASALWCLRARSPALQAIGARPLTRLVLLVQRSFFLLSLSRFAAGGGGSNPAQGKIHAQPYLSAVSEYGKQW